MQQLLTNLKPEKMVAELNLGDLNGVRVVFMNMPLRENAKPNTPPQGPALMAARLRQYGADPSIIDLNGYRIKDEVARQEGKMPIGRHLTYRETESLIEAHFNKFGEPHIIALSGMITTLRWQDKVVQMCRKIAPDTFIISGGGLGTELKEGLFSWISELDAVGHSEGDDIILTITKTIKDVLGKSKEARMRELRSLPFYLGEIAGRQRYIFGGDRPNNLDDLPFAAWDLLEEDVYGYKLLEDYITTPVWGQSANNSSAAPFTMNRSLTSVSSRGCPYSCSFCYRGAQGERLYGMRSAENLAKEARWLIENYKIDFLGFPDDNFAVDKVRIALLPEVFKDLNIRWGTHTRLDEADERLEGMAKSGCVYIGFGAESASASVLDRMDKGGFILRRGLTETNGYKLPVTMVEGIKNCREWNIHANCTWIMGYPGETIQDLKTSVAFILWQKELYLKGLTPGSLEYQMALNSVNQKMFTATAYPGTALFKESVVKEALSENFNISFDKNGDPEFDDAFKHYVMQLDDATKILKNQKDEPLNFSDISMEQFLEARSFVDNNQLEKIMDM